MYQTLGPTSKAKFQIIQQESNHLFLKTGPKKKKVEGTCFKNMGYGKPKNVNERVGAEGQAVWVGTLTLPHTIEWPWTTHWGRASHITARLHAKQKCGTLQNGVEFLDSSCSTLNQAWSPSQHGVLWSHMLLAVKPALHLVSMHLSFLLCEKVMILASNLQGCCEDQIRKSHKNA